MEKKVPKSTSKDSSLAKTKYEKKFEKKIQFRVTTKELLKLDAKRGDLSLGEYAKKTALQSRIVLKKSSQHDIEVIKKLLTELKMIGNNLNQIARNSNIDLIKEGTDQQETLQNLEKTLPAYNLILDSLLAQLRK